EHLLKLPFANDSNSLDKRFYSELLHLIGLREIKQGSKKLIERYPEDERNSASLLENAINKLNSRDTLSQIENLSTYGKTREEQLFAVALELCITWINRILFLKLLEAQLLSYHKGDPLYKFLNIERIKNYDDLDSLFFDVLSCKYDERRGEAKTDFSKIPYLNSSLFEPSDLERKTIYMTDLRDERYLPLLNATVLKNEQGKKLKGGMLALDYLFKFLDAYDFASEDSENIQEENKTLINASVLGLIFEKINGYKDGSYFTPGFITEYMCRETIRRAVVQKFNEAKDWNCKDLKAVYNKGLDIEEANEIVNSLKICDPAVGSGHFLVSALNEILAIKHYLNILCDRDGKRLFDYRVEVENDELIISNEHTGKLFEYNPSSPESQKLQEALFHEKQTIIENCLFGVDINPNSVKICRLRLWIELLKNAYYKNETELETLPNIDINIKCGNSLISRFDIKADLSKALKKSKYDIDSYRDAVHIYQNAQSKEQKRSMKELIDEIKGNFRTQITFHDPINKNLRKLEAQYTALLTPMGNLFEKTKKEKAEYNKKVKELYKKYQKAEAEVEEIKNNKIYENAFEWRFEFPEVLDNNGDFIGFDVVIGNPPYVRVTNKNEYSYFSSAFTTSSNRIDLYGLFYEISLKILNPYGLLSFITPNTFLTNLQYKSLRKLLSTLEIIEILDYRFQVFEDARVDTVTIFISRKKTNKQCKIYKFFSSDEISTIKPNYLYEQIYFSNNIESFIVDISPDNFNVIKKIENQTRPLSEIAKIRNGINPGYPESRKKLLIQSAIFGKNPKKRLDAKDIFKYGFEWKNKWVDYDKDYSVEGGSLREESIFSTPKILIQDIRNLSLKTRIVACYDDKFYYNLYTLHNIQSQKPDIDNKYLLAILNSKMMNFYFSSNFKDIHIKPRYLSLLPIKIATKKEQKPLIKLVDKIIVLKESNSSVDITYLENGIDQLVYELYGLSEKEVKIVEGGK
ncbi:MAG: Eco57I restriction-modification methylase domain-containing protein, partial [Candidatus Marinimicrobia bacterium]|nr:Eco57I restriction-modification methylase domain-containing protein [Candidatus Neomarinimicrobiota bacterium]